MGGNIAVRSTVGQGSRFYFDLKFPWYQTQKIESELPVSLKDHRALIVDDIAINRRILSEYLDSWGVQHEAANSSMGALRLLNHDSEDARPYDLIILDHASIPKFENSRITRDGRHIQTHFCAVHFAHVDILTMGIFADEN